MRFANRTARIAASNTNAPSSKTRSSRVADMWSGSSGGREVKHAAWGEHAVDRSVVRFARHRIENFVIVDDGEHRRGCLHPRERAVVRTTTATESMTGAVDGERGHQHEVGVRDGVAAKARTGRFAGAAQAGLFG